MIQRNIPLQVLTLALLFVIQFSTQVVRSETSVENIVINEIMYHPPTQAEGEEYIELYNLDKTSVDVSGWEFTKGIVYTFPAGTIIEPNGHLVICRVLDEFQATFGDQITALGNFSGLLRNSGERVTLSNRTGETVDSVKYADRSPWPVGADGYSASLERICPTAPGDALNWAPAPLPNDGRRPTGTPGQQNATCSKNLPLAISEVTFQPTNPKANESITVHAKVSGKGKVALLYRVAKSGHVGDEIELPMQIETTGKKSVHYIRRDSRTTVSLDCQVSYSEQFNQWWEEKSGGQGGTRFRNRPSGPPTAERGRGRERGETRRGFGFDRPAPQPAPSPRGKSAFVYISPDTGAYQIFDYVNVTPRAGGYKVRFHKDQPLNGMTTINLIFESNPRFVLAEHLAYEVYKRAGVPTEYSEHIRISLDDYQLGYHLLVEQPNRNFLRRHKRDDSGNLYKILWYEQGVVDQHEKKTNLHTGHDDIVKLVSSLDDTEGEAQWEVIERHFNVEEMINYFAVNLCISNWDGFFNNYFTYHDINGSGKWEIYPWDEDKTWGYYDGGSGANDLYDMPLTFGMTENVSSEAEGERGGFGGFRRPGQPGWWRPAGYFSGPLLANPQFREHFLVRLKEIAETIYTDSVFLPIIDNMAELLASEVRLRAEENGEDVDATMKRFRHDIESLQRHLVKRGEFIHAQDELKMVD